MAWTNVRINIKSNEADTGTVVATYNDATHVDFTFKMDRVTADAEGKTTFATAANAAKDEWLSEKSTEESYESILLTALNA